MKVNGFQIKQAIREQTEERDLAESRFDGSLKAFPGEDKPKPTALADVMDQCERRIARLQTTQARYNLAVQVTVEGQGMTLQEAVKALGGAERLEKKWRDAAKEETDRYGGDTRDKDSVVRSRQVSSDQCAELARTAMRRRNAINYAIQKGNAVEIDLSGELGL